MRITIDTDMQTIIVPDSYYSHVDKLNEVIVEAGGKPLEYNAYIKRCFEKAFETKIIRQSELAVLRKPRRRRNDADEAAR